MTDIPIKAPEPRWVPAKEAARLVRAVLKTQFPETKFSVRTDTYSGGSSVHVRYTDGPAWRDVDAALKPFSGSGFDGMIDLAYSRTAWLYPDGTASHAQTAGTEDSRGSVPTAFGDPLKPGGELVRFACSSVIVSQDIDPAAPWVDVALFMLDRELGSGRYRRLGFPDGSRWRIRRDEGPRAVFGRCPDAATFARWVRYGVLPRDARNDTLVQAVFEIFEYYGSDLEAL